jgi:hypothetical protein
VALPDEIFPAVKRIEVPAAAEMGVAVDGSESGEWWPRTSEEAVLPVFSPYQTRPAQYIEVFNRGRTAFDYRITPSVPWLRVDRPRGRVDKQVRVSLTVDWAKAPRGRTEASVTVEGAGAEVTVKAVAEHPSPRGLRGFVEAGGYVAVDADHYARAVGSRAGGIRWQRIDRIGRTGAGMTPFPVTAPRQRPGGGSPRLEYEVSVFASGPVTVWAYLSPRNPAVPTGGLRYAVSFDEDTPRTVDIHAATGADDGLMNMQWARNTSDNVNVTSTRHAIGAAGVHRLKFWMVDPTVVLQRLVIDTGGLTPTYLGPLESHRVR